MNKRAIIIVLDSFGIGCLPDAEKFGDYGSNTLGHIDKYAYINKLDFNIPNLLSLGLGRAYTEVNKKLLFADKNNYSLTGCYGSCIELSSGKDTTSGHWEMAGCPVLFDWGYFSSHNNSFPKELLDKIVATSGISGYLGNCHASGTEIIKTLGMAHIKTGYPIFYTSADSVLQIAGHETHFGLDNLYKLCNIVRELLEPYNIARVIARPFIGDTPDTFIRTGNRKDYSLLPSSKTLLDICKDSNGKVIAIGKIGDIYAHCGTTVEIKANGLDDLCNQTINAIKTHTKDKTFIMTNLVDFDMQYGHRRDVVGYKCALEYFDTRIPDII
ncbi:MAG: phosphopentomutase, partial [Burkholderiales bacterium]|nr:phosphopentomutase [Burkholderiales bacterium]